MHELRRPVKMRLVIHTAKEPFLSKGMVLFFKKRMKKLCRDVPAESFRGSTGASFSFISLNHSQV